MTAPRVHTCDQRCETIRRYRGLRWTYRRIGEALGYSAQRIQQILVDHVRRAGRREGPSMCVACQRYISPILRSGWILPADVACGWCARRWDGGLYLTPAMSALLERSELRDLLSTQESAQGLRVSAESARGFTGQSFGESGS